AVHRPRVTLAYLVGAPGVVVLARFPDEVVVVLGEHVRAPAPVAHVAQDLVPGALGVLTFLQGCRLPHRTLPSRSRIDSRPPPPRREAGARRSTAGVDPAGRGTDRHALGVGDLLEPPAVLPHLGALPVRVGRALPVRIQLLVERA